MKNLTYFLICFVFLISCKNNAQEKKETTQKEEQKIVYTSFGKELDDKNVLSIEKMHQKFQNMQVGDTTTTKFTAKVIDVCKAKGCWMKLQLNEDEEVMVKFKDYAIFMPKDIENKEVIINGKAFVEQMSVDEQQHYAEDAGKTKEEIAAIKSPKKTYSFEADGVLLKQ